ncbi:hypothetical protein B9479_001764 [Cryptococcus floricola]|uniref:Distal membrane-arm assembly complex protein 1-like domain-containing protein n=1 Tax=Cryptococcus floricola TaxID=2591691 RepID=A0A5D3B122_9TREE|nr:hypothetical protein B9479_001764 [Cryptococcus floricola]
MSSSASTPVVSPSSIPRPQTQVEEKAFPEKDCLTCRLTGAGAFTGIGIYAIIQANNQGAFKKIRPPGAPVVAGKVTALIGTVFIGLGIGRLFI